MIIEDTWKFTDGIGNRIFQENKRIVVCYAHNLLQIGGFIWINLGATVPVTNIQTLLKTTVFCTNMYTIYFKYNRFF